MEEHRNGRSGNIDGGEDILGSQKMTFNKFLVQYNVLIIFILLIVVSSFVSPVFLTWTNVLNILRQESVYIIISMGMLMVMLTGGIDLSVSGVAAVGSIMVTIGVTKWGFNTGLGVFLVILISIGVCTLFGVFNGVLISYLKMPAFLVTLATSIAAQGFAYVITNGSPIALDSSHKAVNSFTAFGQDSDPVLGIPYQIYLVIVIVLIFFFILKYTSFGRLVVATGSNATAAKLAGIDTLKYIFLVYVICGLLTGIGGVLIASSNGASTPMTTASDYNLSTIAGTVIGGTSLMGGEGSAGFTVIGILIIGLIGNIMNLVNLPAYPQLIVKALVIILAVFLKGVSGKNSAKTL